MKGDIWRRRRSTLKCVFLSCMVVQINKAFAAFQHPHIPRFKDEAKKPTKEAAGSKLHQWHTGLLKVYLFLKEHSFWKIISEDPYANRPEFQAIAVKELTWASGSTFPDYPYHSLCRIFARIRSHNLRKKWTYLCTLYTEPQRLCWRNIDHCSRFQCKMGQTLSHPGPILAWPPAGRTWTSRHRTCFDIYGLRRKAKDIKDLSVAKTSKKMQQWNYSCCCNASI